MQENKEEQEILAEGESNLKLPLVSENNFIDKASIINNEAGKLNVDIAVQEMESDGVRIVSEDGMSDQYSNINSPTGIIQSRLQTKYVNQLTLEMIESEGVVKLQDRSKPNTANNKLARPQFKNSLRNIEQTDSEEQKREEGSKSPEFREEKLDQIDGDTNEGDQEDNNEIDIPDGGSNAIEWRQFFTIDELTNAFDKIQQGEDPNDQYDPMSDKEAVEGSVEDGGSDSCPSEDNIELKQLYSAIYCEKNKAKQAVEDLENIEEDYEKNFANFVKAVTKKYRDASKDSNISDGGVLMHTEKRAEERSTVIKK